MIRAGGAAEGTAAALNPTMMCCRLLHGFVHDATELYDPAAPAASSSPTKAMQVVPVLVAELTESWLTRLFVHEAAVGSAAVGFTECSSAKPRIMSAAAGVVVDADVVVGPPTATTVDVFWPSRVALRTPEYSQTVITMSTAELGVIVIVDSVPFENLYQT